MPCPAMEDFRFDVHTPQGNLIGQVWPFDPKFHHVTYGRRKAVAEVSNHNEPIGRKSGSQLGRKSMDFTFSCFVLN